MEDLNSRLEPAAAARAVVARLSGLGESAMDVSVESALDADTFRVETHDGRLRIVATSPVAAASGYAAYARRTGAGSVSRSGTRQMTIMADLDAPLARRSRFRYRVAYNLTVSGYTSPFFDWDDWERELDLIAASGINAAHVTVGLEAVWLETFRRFGYSEAEVLAWIVPPSHQPWQWLNNIQSYRVGTSRDVIERRADLGRRVLARMRELGIRPILPGFSGSVPQDFANKNAGAIVVPQGRWYMDIAGPVRPDWLATNSELYGHVADTFYESQRRLFDEQGWWSVDLLHEGGKLGDHGSLVDAVHGVESAMRRADPEYLWVMQAWGFNPRQEMIDALDRSHVLMLDITGESWRQTAAFSGTPWALGIVPNYGGRHGLYGDLASIAATPSVVKVNGAHSGALCGLTNMGEGVANNPVVWDLFSDLAWTDEPIEIENWLDDWITSRYGARNREAREAWELLLHTAYRTWRIPERGEVPAETLLAMAGQAVDAATITQTTSAEEHPEETAPIFGVYASTDSVIAAVPSVRANQASIMGPRKLHYEEGALVPALRVLAVAAKELDTPGFRYDLVSVARQVLDDEARRILPAVARAVDEADLNAFDQLTALFLRIIEVQDVVLSTHPEMLVGRWIADARRWGSSKEEGAYLVEFAKRLITVWGEADSVELADYTNRNWAGLVEDYYGGRWRLWFQEVRKAMTGEPTESVDWYDFGVKWAQDDRSFATEPSGDLSEAIAAALSLVDEIAVAVPPTAAFTTES